LNLPIKGVETAEKVATALETLGDDEILKCMLSEGPLKGDAI
jgi:hypothetical protein